MGDAKRSCELAAGFAVNALDAINAQSGRPAGRLRAAPSDGTEQNASGTDSTEGTEMDADHSWSEAVGATWAGAGPTVRAPPAST